jgi:uncharacterized phage-associated protein
MDDKNAGVMPRWPFRFDAEKALEAVLFVVPRIADPTLHSVSKILYQADREHMEQYARPISGDRYVAMKHGPVPSATYDILKTVKGSGSMMLPAETTSALRIENEKCVVALRAPRLEVLSASEVECLELSTIKHGKKTFKQLTNDSHDAAWDAADENDLLSLEQFLLTIGTADQLKDHFRHD